MTNYRLTASSVGLVLHFFNTPSLKIHCIYIDNHITFLAFICIEIRIYGNSIALVVKSIEHYEPYAEATANNQVLCTSLP